LIVMTVPVLVARRIAYAVPRAGCAPFFESCAILC
jgi:hypothetical protein